jgi:hypothetical protein
MAWVQAVAWARSLEHYGLKSSQHEQFHSCFMLRCFHNRNADRITSWVKIDTLNTSAIVAANPEPSGGRDLILSGWLWFPWKTQPAIFATQIQRSVN